MLAHMERYHSRFKLNRREPLEYSPEQPTQYFEVPHSHERSNAIERVVNLSSENLSPSMKSLLSRGLGFVPTPKNISKAEIQRSMIRFKYNLVLQHNSENFSGSSSMWDTLYKKLWKPKGDEEMKLLVNSFLQTSNVSVFKELFREIDEAVDNWQEIQPVSNLPKEEQRALRALKCNENIIIKKADKGACVVVQDRENYIKEVERQLTEAEVYTPIDRPLNVHTRKIVNNMVDFLKKKKTVSPYLANLLVVDTDFNEKYFYTLPKIHKESDEWSIPHVLPPGRPIVSGVGSELDKIGKYLDFVFQPHVKRLNSFIQNSEHFLSCLENTMCTENTLLVTLDVRSLYTNISTDKGLAAVRYYLEQDQSKDNHGPSVMTLLRNCLLRNDFMFGDKRFLQLQGTSMGASFAPSYANLFMGKMEETIYALTSFQNVSLWKRFIDDIFCTWESTIEDFQAFIKELNRLDERIKFTVTISTTEVVFLDLVVFKKNGRLCTRVHRKNTDFPGLLHRHSFHPKSTFAGIVKSQILRFARRCTYKEDFNYACNTLFQALRKEGYSRTLLRNMKREVLIEMKCPPGKELNLGFVHCGVKNCLACKYGLFAKFVNSNPPYLISHYLTCRTSNVVYGISCKVCNRLIYIGQTSRNLRARIFQHLSSIRCGYDHPLANHFRKPGHSVEDLRFQGIEYLPAVGDCQRNTERLENLEYKLIQRFSTYKPNGENIISRKTHPTTLVLPYSQETASLGYKIHQLVRVKIGASTRTVFKRHENLQNLLVRRKMKNTP